MWDRWLPHISHRVLLVRDLKRLFRTVHHRMNIVGRMNELNAFRTDIEKTVIDIPRGNFDISAGFAADDMLPTSSLRTTYWMMAFINQFPTVRTNRLHIGIMSAMLGKHVHLYECIWKSP